MITGALYYDQFLFHISWYPGNDSVSQGDLGRLSGHGELAIPKWFWKCQTGIGFFSTILRYYPFTVSNAILRLDSTSRGEDRDYLDKDIYPYMKLKG